MKVKRPSKKVIWEINVTPLTDVALVLLIIFMVSAPMLLQSGIKVKLPSAVTSEKEAERKIVLTVTAEGAVYSGRDLLSKEKLFEYLVGYLAGSQNKIVAIDADKSSASGTVVEVMDIAKRAGADKIYISTIKERKK
jgi:biopolymer transport protein ExbD